VCVYVYPPNVARERLGKNVTAAKNTHATLEELLDLSYERKVGNKFFPEHFVDFKPVYLHAFFVSLVRGICTAHFMFSVLTPP
jgi:hypothetical protein